MHRSALAVPALLLAALPAGATNLVTGNGLGFAVVSPGSGAVTSLYAHPSSFTRPDPDRPLGEGIETANFLESLRWAGSAPSPASAGYEDDSHVVHLRADGGEEYLFMPFGIRRPALVIDREGGPGAQPGAWEVRWRRPVRSRRTVATAAGRVEILRFEGIAESLVLIPLSPAGSPGERGGRQGELSGCDSWALLSLEEDAGLNRAMEEFGRWRGGLGARALERREIAELEHWRVRPPAGMEERQLHLWRQSEVMLRIAQSREPNRPGRHGYGLIVASLPDGVWFTPWVRDMAWATVALARMGHRAEARAALLAYFDARPTGLMRAQTGGADYQVSVVRYFGNGAEEPFFTMEGSTNIEFDDWGEVLWVLGEYLRCCPDPGLLGAPTWRGRLYESARNYIAGPLIRNLEPYDDGLIVRADTSIWEERQRDARHFAFSTAMAIVGLREFAGVAQRAGDEREHARLLEIVARLERGFSHAFIRGGELHGTLEEGVKNDIDGALLTIINLGVVTDPALMRSTVDRMDLLRVASGGYRRVRSTYTDPAIFEYWYERQEFVFVDLSLAAVYRRLGRERDAEAVFAPVVARAARDHNIIPEMYVAVPCKLFPGNAGDPTGARPMAGYGAGAYILEMLDRGPAR